MVHHVPCVLASAGRADAVPEAHFGRFVVRRNSNKYSMTTARLGDAVALPFLPLPFRRVRASVRRLKTGMSASHRNANPSTLRNRGALQAGVSRSEYLRPIGTSIPRRGGIRARACQADRRGIIDAEDACARRMLRHQRGGGRERPYRPCRATIPRRGGIWARTGTGG